QNPNTTGTRSLCLPIHSKEHCVLYACRQWRREAATMAEEDFFSDDDLDDIPANTLDRLEQQAFRSTQQFNANPQLPRHVQQQQPPQSSRPPVPLRKQAHTASSLNRPGSAKNLPWRPPQSTFGRPSQKPPQPQIPSAPPASAPRPPSSDYGFDDEDVIDLDEPSTIIQPAPQIQPHRPSYQQRPAQRNGGRASAALDPETAAAFAAADEELGSQTFGRWPQAVIPQRPKASQAGTSMDMAALQARIAELEAEQARLRASEQQARDEARAKQGEIAIVRSNQEKTTKQYEARISVMQRLHAEEAAKSKAELEAQRKEREKMETDNRFLQHDLAQEAERTKRLTGPSRAQGTQRQTPRKSKRTALGDGFDDGELHMTTSPSRSRDKLRGDLTPKAGAKRKRPAHDSPVHSLSFTQPPAQLRHESTGGQSAASFASTAAPDRVTAKKDDRYEFMQLLLNHFPHEGHATMVESLAKYSFPSQPTKTLSSIFMHDISYLSDDESLPLKVAEVCIGLWSKCIAEKYFAPFYMILELVRFALQTQTSAAKSQLLEQAVPLCIQTIDLIAIPTYRASTNRKFAASLDRKAFDEQADEIDVERVLELLQDLCNAASLQGERIETFWRTMEQQFVLLMLNKAQPIGQVMTLLEMLQTAAREATFGVIAHDATRQPELERGMIDRLTNLLFEVLEAAQGEEPYSDAEILELRIEVLKVLRQMCQTDHGGMLLVQNRSAIGRLVRFLDAHVRKLYHTRPTYGLSEEEKPRKSATHDLLAQCVNITVRLIYHLLRVYGDNFDFVPKLHAVHGGYHKFLVSMTRIAFTEQHIFEAGIEDEAAEAAHRILDSVLGPEDGEAVMKAIETPRGTRGSTTEKATTSGERTHGDSQMDDTTMSEPG
ncbi:hypothetical protein HII31_01765, partial [Pseudocercospora fuligena]